MKLEEFRAVTIIDPETRAPRQVLIDVHAIVGMDFLCQGRSARVTMSDGVTVVMSAPEASGLI